MTDRRSKERKPSITMYEIARLAGVSQSTVSRVLNGKSVAPEKQMAVQEVMDRLNYRPNVTAQGLVTGKTSTIGVLTRHLGSPFFGEVLRGIAKGMQGSNYNPIIGLGSEISSEELHAIDLLLARQPDGLILMMHASKHLTQDYLLQINQETPLIIIGGMVPGLEKQCVVMNNVYGAYMATSYLINKGHTRIAHISGQSWMTDSTAVPDAAERQKGYFQALEDHNIPIDPDLVVEGDFTEASGTMAAEKLFARRDKHPFTAIFAANDQMAMGARLVMFHRQIDVPEDVSLIGFDDLPASQYMSPPMTTVRQPAYYSGVVASQAMLAMLNGENFHIPPFALELVVRQSVVIR